MKSKLTIALLLFLPSLAYAQFSQILRFKNSGTLVTPTRPYANCKGGISCVDDPANNATDIDGTAVPGTTTLQQAYNNSAGAVPSILLTAANSGVTIYDAATPIGATTNLFGVNNNGATTNFLAIYGDVSTANTSATSQKITGGVGGASDNTANAGTGGGITLTGGAGGAGAATKRMGAGGAITLLGGNAGANNGTSFLTSSGGAISATGGIGSPAAGAGAVNGTAGGSVTAKGGAGGAAAAGTGAAGNGGASNLVGGVGGAASATGAAGTGGAVNLTAATGGAGAAAVAAGAGGNIVLTAGNAGADGGGGTGNGGNISFDAGGSSAGTAGTITVGVSQTSAISIGFAGITTTFGSNVAQSGTATFSTGTGAVSLNGDTTVASQKQLNLGTYTTAQLPGVCADGALAWDSTTTQVKRCKSNAWAAFETTSEFNFSAYDHLTSTTLIAPLSTTTVTYASTIVDSKFTSVVAGMGGGNYVEKLCSDGATCADAAHTYVTCTLACTATGTTTCTINTAAVPAATTLTWNGTTACATNNPAFNVNVHFTNP